MFQKDSSSIYPSRYCSQVQFKIIFCGGCDIKSDTSVASVKHIDGINFNKTKKLSSMNEERSLFKAICIKGEIYVFGGITNATYYVNNVEKCTLFTNTWTTLTNIFDKRLNFCGCSFID